MISEIGKLASQIHQLRHDIMNNNSLTDVERENLFTYMRDQSECGLETMKIVRDTLENMITRVEVSDGKNVYIKENGETKVYVEW